MGVTSNLAKTGIKALGLMPVLRRLGKGAVALFYHGVTDDPAKADNLHLPLAALEAQARFLKQSHKVVSLGELAADLAQGRDPSPLAVLITFDDGFLNHLTLAAPLLQSLGLPFAVFVNTDGPENASRLPTWVARQVLAEPDIQRVALPSQALDLYLTDRASRQAARARVTNLLKTLPQAGVRALLADLRAALPPDRWAELEAASEADKPLTWPQVKRLTELGATIGSHCHEHAILHADQPDAEVRAQLATSRELIAAHLGACDYLAYPNGHARDCSPAAQAVARELGYRLAFTTEPGRVNSECDPMLVPRLPAPSGSEHLATLEWMLARQR